MNRFSSGIRQAVANQNWFAALYLALTMPDVCGALEDPKAGNGARYRSWFERYLAPINKINILGTEAVFMTAGDCWALRCSLLHEGSDEVSQQKAKDVLSRFFFTTIGAHRIRVEDTLTLNVARFCEEIADAVDKWAADTQSDVDIQARVSQMVQIRQGGFSPTPGVRIGSDAA
jgi:hypothetical protein